DDADHRADPKGRKETLTRIVRPCTGARSGDIFSVTKGGREMKRNIFRVLAVLSIWAGASVIVPAQSVLPNPILVFDKQEEVTTAGKTVIRYSYTVFNFDAYPAALFAASPNLPPCGKNTKAARTWVDI